MGFDSEAHYFFFTAADIGMHSAYRVTEECRRSRCFIGEKDIFRLFSNAFFALTYGKSDIF